MTLAMLAFLLGSVGGSCVATAAEPATPGATSTIILSPKDDKKRAKLVTQKLRLVTALLNSPAVSKVAKSDSSDENASVMRARLIDVNQTLERVRADLGANRLKSAEENVNRALTIVGQLTRKARASDSATQKLEAARSERRFTEARDSIVAIRKSLEEAVKQKNSIEERLTLRDLNRIVGEAETLARKGKFAEARRKLSQAQDLSETAIARLRDNDTVVYDLRFKSAEEEFHYEIERNQSHHMLINVMLGERSVSARVRQLIEKRVAQSNEFLSRAQERAKAGEYDAAVELMEQATQILMTALQYLGP